MPEVIEDGVSGVIVDTWSEMAADRADALDPNEQRRAVEERFSPRRMVHDYLAAYRKTIQKWGTKSGLKPLLWEMPREHSEARSGDSARPRWGRGPGNAQRGWQEAAAEARVRSVALLTVRAIRVRLPSWGRWCSCRR